MRRVAFIGDVGGHADQLRDALLTLGADPDRGELPPGLTVVQVGDLVHRGPDSAGVVDLVARFASASPDRWHQVVGNHEARYLRRSALDLPEEIPGDTAETLRQWWESGWMRTAATVEVAGAPVVVDGQAITAGAGTVLVTHAGLTAGLYQRLGCPGPREVAAAVEADARSRPPGLAGGAWGPGITLTGTPHHSAGVVWAAAAQEVIPSWLAVAGVGSLPGFHQVHGHTRAYRYRTRSRRGLWTTAIRRLPTTAVPRHVDPYRRVTRVVVPAGADCPGPHGPTLAGRVQDGMVLWGVDPGHRRVPASRWAPLLLDATGDPGE